MIKKNLVLAVFLIFGCFGLFSSAHAERIKSFDVKAIVDHSGTANITEYIKYDFEGAERHGIYRFIPLKSADGPDIAINVLDVIDETGNTVPFSIERSNLEIKIRIGDSKLFVSGTKTYRIDYEVFGSIRFFEDYDEFYWNATGNDWQIPIDSASLEISAESEFLNATSTSCYIGVYGSTERNCGSKFSESGKDVLFSANRNLLTGEGLTASVLFPKGEIDQTIAYQKFKQNDKSISIIWFFVIFLPLAAGFMTIFIWVFVISTKKVIGDRRLKNRPIVVQYSPPDNFSVTETAYVAHRDFRANDMGAVVISLAVDGYLKIIYPKDFFWGDNKYELAKIKDGESISDIFAKKVFEYLFPEGVTSVKINDLDFKKRAELISGIQGLVRTKLREKDIFVKKSWMGKLSDAGLEALWKIFGFVRFLEATEKDKLELLNAPELKPEIFEKFLPYAMILGVEKKWAKKFENIFTTAPNWVEGYPAGTQFNAVVFANSMSSVGRSVSGQAAHSSGAGGGGHSGGGSGGGGGGSW